MRDAEGNASSPGNESNREGRGPKSLLPNLPLQEIGVLCLKLLGTIEYHLRDKRIRVD